MLVSDQKTQITSLKVEYQKNPLGVDVDSPRFSWTMISEQRGQTQFAFQILVATTPELLMLDQANVWDSGIIISNQSVGIRYNGPSLTPSTRYYWKVIVLDQNKNTISSSSDNFFESGLKSMDGVEGWDGAQWISMANKSSKNPGAPMLRKVTPLQGKVKAARLYVSSLGVYSLSINDQKLGIVGDDGNIIYEHLTPGWTNYDRTVNYMTYDVTPFIQKDTAVTLAAVLGNGWYNGRISVGSHYYSEDGNDLALLAKLNIVYEDGIAQSIVTDTVSGWRATDDGPYRENDIYDGETYDATKELTGWDTANFDDSNWSGVKEHPFTSQFPETKVVSYHGVTARIIESLTQHPSQITVYDDTYNEETSQNGKGEIKIKSTFTGFDSVGHPIEFHSGETAIFDLGQNVVGVPKLVIKGRTGTQVRLRFGEILNDESVGADGPKGSVYFANLRTAKQTALYTLKGDPNGENYQPALTFFGFRYVEISILTPNAAVEIFDLTGKVATSLTEQHGTLETSNSAVNQLISNILWGHRGNYFWIPTDCPQRDERLGWTGDTQLFAKTALYNGNSHLFLENFMDILVDSQKIYGLDQASFTSTAPGKQHTNFNSFAFTGKGPKGQSGWADIGVILPWTVWQMTGDLTIVEKHYDSMVSYMDWLYSVTGDTYKGPGGIGDWLGFQGTGNQFISDAYYAYDALLMVEMTRALGKEDDSARYQGLFDQIKTHFIKRYFSLDDSGRLTVKSSIIEDKEDIFEAGIHVYRSVKEDNTQTALLWCLKLGLYENESQKEQLIDLLTQNIKNEASFRAEHPDSTRINYAENTISIGFLGVNIIAPVLSDHGLSDLSYALLLQDQMPSWLYSVKNGATTIWERWNSYSIEDGFGDVGMNSFNHYSYGAIAEWMFQYMAGISYDREAPGFKHILLKPTIDPSNQITKVKGTYKSVYGPITSSWEVREDSFLYLVGIPANTTATLFIPSSSIDDVQIDDLPCDSVEGVTVLGFDDGVTCINVVSGTYTLKSKLCDANVSSILK